MARDYSLHWQREPQSLGAYLARQGELSTAELAAVVRVDLRERWRHGERPVAEDYLVRYPQLAADAEAAVDVIYAEFLARENVGEQPTAADFGGRFPQHAAVLADQIQLHQAFEQAAESPSATSGPEGNLRIDYEILDEIGRGGMGVVYRARQTGLNRLVALKMVRHADLANDEVLSRFRAEAEVVASLHHPHIVQVYDYGEHEGCPYLALELLEGGTLADRLNGKPWNVRRAAELVEQIARAVHFAHEHGVVHRDLKPNNLLVGTDGNPPQVKIADFGLARIFRDQASGQTQTGALLGTPSYMAPEQALGRQSEIGPATDIYALGAILYELLCGRPPYRGETSIETLQQVLLAEPASLHRVAPGLPRDLATICAKCLDRAPARRYRSAQALADDLQRFLADRPIEARPATSWERGWRWCRRNPALAGSLGFVAMLLVAVSIVSTWYSSRLSRQLAITQRAELAERKANDAAQLRLWEAYLSEIAARNASRQQGQRFAALETIERAGQLLPALGATEERRFELRNAAIRSLSLPDLRRVRDVWTGSEFVHSAAVSLAAKRIALNVQGTALVWGDTDGKVLARLNHGMSQSHVKMSPDGRLVALSGIAGTRVWHSTGTALELAWQDAGALELSFAPDGQHAVIHRNRGGLTLIDAATGSSVRSLIEQEPSSACWFHEPSNRLAVHLGTEAVIIDWKTGVVETRLPHGESVNVRMAWHPDGETLAIWASSRSIELWNLRTGEIVLTLPQRTFPQQMEFTADGARLVSCGLWDSRLALWDVGTGQKEFEVQGFDNLAMDFDAAGNLELFKHNDGRVELWQVAAGSECRLLPSVWFPWSGVRYFAAISPDKRVLALSGEGGLELWDFDQLKRIASRPSTRCMAQFDRHGDLILAVDSAIYRWPRNDQVRDRQKIITFGPPSYLSDIGDPTSLVMCTSSDRIVFETERGWQGLSLSGDRKRVRFKPSGDPRKAALSSDGKFVALANWEAGGSTVWDFETGNQLATLATQRWGKLDFSPDGRWLATTPGGVQLWRTADWSLARNLHAIGTTPNGLGTTFSPDSRVLAVGQTNGEVRLVDPQTGKDWASLMHPTPGLSTILAFTRDNRKLVCLPSDEFLPVRVWDLAAIRRSLAQLELDWPDDVLATSSSDETDAIDAIDLKIEWNEAGWSLFQKTIKALRRPAVPAK